MSDIREKLQPLRKLAGTWQTTGKVHATATSPELIIKGTDTYTWLPGEYFMIHTVDVHIGDEHNQTHEIIGFEKGKDFFFTHYFDNKGQSGTMIIMVSEPLWVIHGGSQRFTGGMSADGQEFSGIWEQLDDEKQWIPFMEIRLSR
jgi:hypothetical protein